jgi:LmbE family N-acetylglucosaminyl deacetylase
MITTAPTAPILAIAAHPDDIESWCAGTLVQAIDGGATVHLLLVTSGDRGANDPKATPVTVAQQREAEAQAAAAHLGIKEVTFLRYTDGEVENTIDLRRNLVAAIRRWRPYAIFTHDPEHTLPPYITHRDHRVVGRATLDAVYPLARDHLNFPELAAEGLTPHAVSEVWLFASSVANEYVNISSTLERKIEARLLHTSQTADGAALRDGWRKRAAVIGEPAGLVAAEAFTVLRLE